jgi:hypothetical protein
MDQQLILQPVAAMFLLTAAVWAFMYARRLPFILRNGIDPQSISTPELLNARIPAPINHASNNLKNLFELPVVFYALCTALVVAGHVDTLYLQAAWAFVGIRAAHSLVHCTVNVVSLRFTAYFLSSLVLWFMVVRFALAVL